MSAGGPGRVWTIRDLLAWTRPYLEERGVDSARLTAEILLSTTLGVPRIRLYTDLDRPLEKPELARFRELIVRRAAGEPTQYLVGHAEFYGRRFDVDPRVLIPRPETELVVERVLRALPRDAEVRVADVGCGSGAIGLTLAAERPLAGVVLSDVSPDAVALAGQNAARLGVVERVELRVGSLWQPHAGVSYDAVAANLPYLADAWRAQLPVHIREHEPKLALFGGADGLALIRALVAEAPPYVRPGGLLVLEHAEEQGETVRALFEPSAWEPAVTELDLAGLDRFTWAQRR